MSSSGFVANSSACFQPISQLSILNISPVAVLSEDALRLKAQQEAAQCLDPVHRVRLRCLAVGIAGPKLVLRKLLSLGKDRLSLADFGQCLLSVPGLHLADGEAQKAFQQLAGDQSADDESVLETAELVRALTPPISPPRRTLVEQVFAQMDPQGQGTVPLSALARLFEHRRHPKFESGLKTREELFAAFLAQFVPDSDGQVLASEFLAFHAAQSAAVDSDIHFDWLVRNIWKI